MEYEAAVSGAAPSHVSWSRNGQGVLMPVVAVLLEFVHQLDEVDDFRKEMPVILELKKQTLCAIAELEAAQAERLIGFGQESPTLPRTRRSRTVRP